MTRLLWPCDAHAAQVARAISTKLGFDVGAVHDDAGDLHLELYEAQRAEVENDGASLGAAAVAG